MTVSFSGCCATQGPLPRAELARRSRLSPTTLTKLTARLIEYGIIGETELPADAAPSAFIGRPPIDITLLSDSFYVLAVHIGLGTVRVALANLRADLSWKRISGSYRSTTRLRRLSAGSRRQSAA